MRKQWGKIILASFITALAVLGPVYGMAEEVVDMEGEVGENYLLVDRNGEVYEIADTTQGSQLAEKHVGERVKVTGTIERDADYRVIVVTSFQTLAE